MDYNLIRRIMDMFSFLLGSVSHQLVTARSIILASSQILFLVFHLRLGNVNPVVLLSLDSVKVCNVSSYFIFLKFHEVTSFLSYNFMCSHFRSFRLHWATDSNLSSRPCEWTKANFEFDVFEVPEDEKQEGSTAKFNSVKLRFWNLHRFSNTNPIFFWCDNTKS